MNMHITSPGTIADVLSLIDQTQMSGTRRRDMVSAISRICEMAGCSPSALSTNVGGLREMLSRIRPARHEVTEKTFSNLKTLLRAALELVGVIEPMGRGIAKSDSTWGPLLKAIANDKRLTFGLAAFANWCADSDIAPQDVKDQTVQDFFVWLDARTLCPQPCNVVRRVPHVWNDARQTVEGWPQIELAPISFRAPSEHLTWEELDDGLHRDAKAYLAAREHPDLFDERPNAPRSPLEATTLRLQREHIRLAASLLVRLGVSVDEVTSLACLVEPEAFKTILRHYHDQAGGKPNAHVVGLAMTLIQVARYHADASEEHLNRLKKLVAKLPPVPFDLTEKNKAMLRQFESKRVQAKLFFLPQQLMSEAADSIDKRHFRFVDAQVATAVDIILIAPLRPQNLISLNWGRHFIEPDGPKGRLLLYIPAEETKTKKRELVFDLAEDVAHRLRWYRRHILSRLGGNIHGDLFVTKNGTRKCQDTFTDQIIERIESHVGVHVTPHQFRHLAAKFYLDKHPEDFRTVTDLLGHSSAKSTLIYAGMSSQRASRAYSKIICDQRETLKLKRRRRKSRKKK